MRKRLPRVMNGVRKVTSPVEELNFIVFLNPFVLHYINEVSRILTSSKGLLFVRVAPDFPPAKLSWWTLSRSNNVVRPWTFSAASTLLGQLGHLQIRSLRLRRKTELRRRHYPSPHARFDTCEGNDATHLPYVNLCTWPVGLKHARWCRIVVLETVLPCDRD